MVHVQHRRRQGGPGDLHAAQRKLRGGRRQHVPLRLLRALPEVGAEAPRLLAAVALGRAGEDQPEARRLHHGHPREHPGVRQDGQHGGDQLPVRAQEAAKQAPRPRPHQGDHPPRQPGEYLAGGLYSRRRAPEARVGVPVLAPVPEPEEADRGLLLALGSPHDHGEDDQAVQGPRAAAARWHPEDGEEGRPESVRARQRLPEEVPAAPGVHSR
mmetsp:Transcript_73865/g.207409  ORF Transcript_73865/g.207409 Transcript_73865/m.207409 type:complete len:213 (+) Transcript_73865:443-1081(+)